MGNPLLIFAHNAKIRKPNCNPFAFRLLIVAPVTGANVSTLGSVSGERVGKAW
jgi:hypothetical protein